MLSSLALSDVFGAEEILVAAKKLVGLNGIDYADVDEVEYFHMLLDRHEVITADGALSETLLPGPMALKSLGKAALRKITAIFPEPASAGYAPTPARQIPAPQVLREFLKQQAANGGALSARAPDRHREVRRLIAQDGGRGGRRHKGSQDRP